MKSFRMIAYIKKYQIPIVVLSILAGLFFYRYLQGQQVYTASAVIQYTNEGASEGMAPDGTEINTSDIYSVQVMTEVFENMGLSYGTYNLDDFRSRVSVDEIVTEEMQIVQEARNSTGEVVDLFPTQYTVSFTANASDSDRPVEFARQVLDNILDVYLSNYGEEHVASSVAYNAVSEIDQTNYDYLEIIEIIEGAIGDTLSKIEAQMTLDPNFRAAANGYSFQDLYRKFSLLSSVEVSEVYAYILNNQVTKDREVLLSKYENRIQDFYLYNEAAQSDIDGVREIIDTYVRMMRESGNTNILAEYILDGVETSAYEDASKQIQNYDQTVEYDKLLESYITNRTEFEQNLIDVAYCQYVLDVYNGVVSSASGADINTEVQEEEYIGELADSVAQADTADGTGDAEAQQPADGDVSDVQTGVEEEGILEQGADGTATSSDVEGDGTAATGTAAESVQSVSNGNVVAANSPEAVSTVEMLLDDLIEETVALYDELETTSEEFYDYAGAQNVSVMTNIIVSENIQILLYAGIVVLLIATVCCAAAIVIGRLEDILDYYVLRDKKTGLPNRAGCDKYMASYSNKLLPDHFGCFVIRLLHIKDKNEKFGREACDAMIRRFADILKNVFPQDADCFIALNGIGQFMIFSENMPEEHMETYAKTLRSMVEEQNRHEECAIEYEIGMAESKTSDTYRITLLMMRAIHDIYPEVTEDEEKTEA